MRSSLLAVTALAVAALTACSSPAAPSPATTGTVGPTGPADPGAQIGVVLSQGDEGPHTWLLTATRDEQDRLCMSLVDRFEGAEMARTCGLPKAAATGSKFMSAPGMGTDLFYYGAVSGETVKVKLDFADGGSKTVKTQPMPSSMVDSADRFFLLRVDNGKPGVATGTMLDDDGKALPTS